MILQTNNPVMDQLAAFQSEIKQHLSASAEKVCTTPIGGNYYILMDLGNSELELCYTPIDPRTEKIDTLDVLKLKEPAEVQGEVDTLFLLRYISDWLERPTFLPIRH